MAVEWLVIWQKLLSFVIVNCCAKMPQTWQTHSWLLCPLTLKSMAIFLHTISGPLWDYSIWKSFKTLISAYEANSPDFVFADFSLLSMCPAQGCCSAGEAVAFNVTSKVIKLLQKAKLFSFCKTFLTTINSQIYLEQCTFISKSVSCYIEKGSFKSCLLYTANISYMCHVAKL